jgi:hypothetical protein
MRTSIAMRARERCRQTTRRSSSTSTCRGRRRATVIVSAAWEPWFRQRPAIPSVSVMRRNSGHSGFLFL